MLGKALSDSFYAAEIKLRAERKMGELLAKREPPKGTRGQLKGSTDGRISGGHIMIPPENNEPTLAELGLTKRESAQAQKLATRG